eukprot:3231641-Pyramimonas_sp.AAC.1
MHDEYPSAWIFQRQPITGEEARGYMNAFTSLTRNEWVLEQRRRKGTHGTTLSDVPGIFGDHHDRALAASSGTMVDGMLTSTGHRQQHQYPWSKDCTDMRACVTLPWTRHQEAELDEEVVRVWCGNGAAICDKSLHYKTESKVRGDPAGKPAMARLDTYSTNVAEGSGENIPSIL